MYFLEGVFLDHGEGAPTKSNDLNIKVRRTKSWSATKRGFIWVAKKRAPGGKKRAQGEITET